MVNGQKAVVMVYGLLYGLFAGDLVACFARRPLVGPKMAGDCSLVSLRRVSGVSVASSSVSVVRRHSFITVFSSLVGTLGWCDTIMVYSTCSRLLSAVCLVSTSSTMAFSTASAGGRNKVNKASHATTELRLSALESLAGEL